MYFNLARVVDLITRRMNSKQILNVILQGLAISSIFLAITLLVYIALPPLRNLHGKTIMCHVASMLVAFSCLARVQWTIVAPGYCTVLGIYFDFFLFLVKNTII